MNVTKLKIFINNNSYFNKLEYICIYQYTYL